MAEFVIKLADERGRMQEQIHSAASADELRHRFTQAGYYVYSVRARGLSGAQRKIKLEPFLIFNQQFLTLVRAGLPIVQALELLAKRPDLTLQEIRGALAEHGISIGLSSLWRFLKAQTITLKKRASMPPSRTAPTSPRSAGSSSVASPRSIPTA